MRTDAAFLELTTASLSLERDIDDGKPLVPQHRVSSSRSRQGFEE